MRFKSRLRGLLAAVNRRLDDYGVFVNQRSFVKGIRLYRKWTRGFAYSIPEMVLLKQMIRSSDTVLDVGANIGEFSFFFSTIVSEGVIHCFEPQRKPFGVLQGVCHNLKNVHPHRTGFSSSPGKATLFIPMINGHMSPPEASLDPRFNDFTGSERRPKATESIPEVVQMTTLDGFIEREALDRLDFAKIDVEGHELEVLKGGRCVCLQKHRPLFLIEVSPYAYQGRFEAVIEYLANCAYVGFVLTKDRSGLQPLTLLNANNSPGYNYFFVPREKTQCISRLVRHL